MGLRKFLKKAIMHGGTGGFLKKPIDSLTKPIKVELQNMLGIGALKDMAAGQEETLRRQGEAAKLDTMNEVDNITQFDDTGGDDFTGGGSRRKKRGSGAYSSGIGLKY